MSNVVPIKPTRQTTPHSDTEAERHTIGAILLSSGKVLDYLNLDPADYQNPLHEQIHATALALRAKGTPPDVVTVAEALRRQRVRFEDTYLHQLAGGTATPTAAEHYAAIVRDAAARRRALEAATVIHQGVDAHAAPEAIVEAAQKALDGIAAPAEQDPVRFISETINDSIAEWESKPNYTPTPWRAVNDMIGGLKPGALYVIGARPAVGKSVVAAQLALSLARTGSVPFISLEMRTTEVHARMMAATAKVSVSQIEKRQLTDPDWERISTAVPTLEALPIAVLDRTSATIGQIRRYVTAASKRRPLAGVIVDYLQLIQKPPGDQRPRHEYIADLTRTLKTLAMELQTPVVLLSQLNRNSTSRDSKMPELADLRESGAIEQDADVVILLHRLIDDPAAMHEIIFRVAKNRQGRPGTITLDFHGHYSEIRDD